LRVISISKPVLENLKAHLFTPDGNENAAFAVCGFSKTEATERLYVRRVFNVPVDGYVSRTPVHLEVSPRFINAVIDESQNRLAVVVMHSHPGGLTSRYSASDDFGEERLLRVFSDLIPSAPHSSLLFSEKGVIGRFWTDEHFSPLVELRVLGASLPAVVDVPRAKRGARLVRGAAPNEELYNRQVMAFGPVAQRQLERLKVAVIGVGGTGSCVVEQLARLGVSELMLIDPDNFDTSNLTRMYGSSFADIAGKPRKTEIVKNNVLAINPSATVATTTSSIISRSALSSLVDRDVVFCCTDNESSRAVLNRFAYQYFVPVIDMGSRIVVSNGRIIGASGRTSVVGPGLPCLWCGFHLDADRIRSESLPADERRRLTAEGYVEGMDVKAPSVVSLNSTVASLSITMVLGMIAPFGEVPGKAPEQIYDAVEGIVFRVTPTPNPDCHVCGKRGVVGYGDLEPVTTFK
jgi:molybdopterin-synthase adenylyltransferase